MFANFGSILGRRQQELGQHTVFRGEDPWDGEIESCRRRGEPFLEIERTVSAPNGDR
jgi:hypothetical protein